MIGYVYCLKNGSGRIIYVGQTIRNLTQRLGQHFATRHHLTGSKINEYLYKSKRKPSIHLLEEVSFRKKERLLAAEEKWVVYLTSIGCKLLNDRAHSINTAKKIKNLLKYPKKCPICGCQHPNKAENERI